MLICLFCILFDFFSNNQKYDRLEFLIQLSMQTDKELTTPLPILPFLLSLPSCQSMQSDDSPTDFWIFTTPYNTLLHLPSGELVYYSNTLSLQFKTTVWQVHTLLVPIGRPSFATLIPYTIRYLLQSYDLAFWIPHRARPCNLFISCNLHYHFEKSHPNRQLHSIYRSAVLFTADFSLQSESTLLFSEINPPIWGVHTFYQSAAIWFYWLYTIISKNLPLLIDSIQSID